MHTRAMTQPIACSTCGRLNPAHEDFCLECGSLAALARGESTSADVEPALSGPAPGAPPRPRSFSSNTPSVAPASEQAGATLECWDCGTANTHDRSFCVSCGVWLHTSSPPPAPKPVRAPTAGVALGSPTIAFGSVAAVDRASRKSRNVIALVTSLAAVGVIAVSGLSLAPAWLEGDAVDDPTSLTAAAPEVGSTLAELAAMPAQAEPAITNEVDAAVLPETGSAGAPSEDEPNADQEALGTQASATLAPVEAPLELAPFQDGEPLVTAREARILTDATAADDVQAPTERDGPSAGSGPADPNAWVCDGDMRIEDPMGRRWSVTKVSFLPRNGYERVVLHIQRTGPGGGALAAVTAQAFDTSTVQRYVAGASRPGSGGTTVGVHLVDGIASAIGLRRYRPQGMRTVKEFSVYPAARRSSKVLVSSNGDGCFRLKVPAWGSADSATSQKAQILLDVRR